MLLYPGCVFFILCALYNAQFSISRQDRGTEVSLQTLLYFLQVLVSELVTISFKATADLV